MSTLNSLPVLKPKKVESTEQPKSDKELERLRKIRERYIYINIYILNIKWNNKMKKLLIII